QAICHCELLTLLHQANDATPQSVPERHCSKPMDTAAAPQSHAGRVRQDEISLERLCRTNRHYVDPSGESVVDTPFANVSADDFGGLIYPCGCVGADNLWVVNDAVA